MTLESYVRFVKEREEFDEAIEEIAQKYFNIWENLTGASDNRTHISSVSSDEDEVVIYWFWNGPMSSQDSGSIEVPVDVFFDDSKWEEFIKREIEKEKSILEAEENQRKIKELITARQRVAELEAKLDKNATNQ